MFRLYCAELFRHQSFREIRFPTQRGNRYLDGIEWLSLACRMQNHRSLIVQDAGRNQLIKNPLSHQEGLPGWAASQRHRAEKQNAPSVFRLATRFPRPRPWCSSQFPRPPAAKAMDDDGRPTDRPGHRVPRSKGNSVPSAIDPGCPLHSLPPAQSASTSPQIQLAALLDESCDSDSESPSCRGSGSSRHENTAGYTRFVLPSPPGDSLRPSW
jgi:hypothetical protein